MANASGVLACALYAVWCDDATIYVRTGSSAAGLSDSTGYPVRPTETYPVLVLEGEKLCAYSASAATVRFHRIS